MAPSSTDDRPPTPRLSATVALVRDAPGGPEVLLTKRPESLRFLGGVTVFPGGAVDDADLDERWERVSVLDRASAAARLDTPDGRAALGAFVAAIRESFEEVGWRAALPAGATLDKGDADDARRFLDRCLESDASLATDRLIPAGRWVTPEGAPIRFDTFFFVARAEDGWTPAADRTEVDAVWWATPEDALARRAAGELVMAPPTIEMLQRLSGHADAATLIASLDAPASGTGGASRLSPFVQAVVAPNAGVMTGPGTNTYIVGAGPCFVIDPAVDDPAFLDAVVRAAGRVEQILVTHRHADHVGGAAALADATGAPVRAFGSAPAGDARVAPVNDSEELDAGGVRLVALHTPGHAADHLSYFMEDATSLFAGDNVLGEGTAVIAPPEGNMKDYLASLRRLAALRIGRIYPGHWPALDGGVAVIERYIAHRLEREAAIKAAVAAGASTVEEIVERVYVDTPAHLHPIAAYSVAAHLEMLAEAGIVKRENERWAPSTVD